MLTIGRISLIRDPTQMAYDGDHLSFSGQFHAVDLDHAKVIRGQMLGLYPNDDEPDVPVTWEQDPAIDGYYTVKAVNVTTIRPVSYKRFIFQYSVQLERVQGGFAAPLCEVALTLAVRTNAHSVTAPVGWITIPTASSFRRGSYSSGDAVAASGGRDTASGQVTEVFALPSAGSFASFVYSAAAADYYDGAVMIEQLVGATWFPVVGDQIGVVAGTSLRIGNGIVRLTYAVSTGHITIELWDSASGGQWESATAFFLSIGSVWDAGGGWRILRNSPEACTIQSSAEPTQIPQRILTFHLDRGSFLVHIAADGTYYELVHSAGITTVNDASLLQANVSTACTSITGGIRQTSNDANGHRWLMVSPSAVTKNTTIGNLSIAAQGVPFVAQFGLGFERNGSAAGITATQIADAYFAAIGQRQRIVAR